MSDGVQPLSAKQKSRMPQGSPRAESRVRRIWKKGKMREKRARKYRGYFLNTCIFNEMIPPDWCGGGDLNPYALWALAPQASASANFATSA
jgi:hypothetical protein